jgi:ribosomal protein L37AE/L43A
MANIERGFQCPECFGVQIETRRNRFDAGIDGWLCNECGCHWSEPVILHTELSKQFDPRQAGRKTR